MKRTIIWMILCGSVLCTGMEKDKLAKGKERVDSDSPDRRNSSGESSPARFPLMQILAHESRRHTSPKLSSPLASPRPATPSPEDINLKKSSSPSGESRGNSPRGGRISRTLGKKESNEIRERLSTPEKDDISLTEQELEFRFESVQKELNTDKKRKELEELVSANITSFDAARIQTQASVQLIEVIAQSMATTFQNRLTYLSLGQKGIEEAKNQVSTARKLFWQQFDLLMKFEGSRIQAPHEHRWNNLIRMIPVFLKVEEYSKKSLPADILKQAEEKEAIKKELFMPK